MRWRERDAKRKAGRLPHRQRETCSRLHRDGARQSKRRERARAARESEELASLASGKFRMTGKSKALARHVQPRGRAGASIHERLHDEHDELVYAEATRLFAARMRRHGRCARTRECRAHVDAALRRIEAAAAGGAVGLRG